MGVITIKAVIMAGGEGTRLRPLTCSLPKPMVPILNKPIMEYIIKLLKGHHIHDIAVTLAYLPDTIIDYFDKGEEWGVDLHYYVEKTPLGTGGSVRNTQDFLDDTFIVISGDALTDIDLKHAMDFHKKKKSKATLVLKKEAYPLDYGVVVTDEDGRILRFLEKPSWGEVFSDTINTGIYILEPEIMNYFDKGVPFDFSKDLFPKLLKDDIPMYGYVSEDYWCDIGDLSTYTRSQFDILKGQVAIGDILHGYTEIQKDIWVGKHVLIHGKAVIHPPAIIGDQSGIGQDTIIGPGAVIGKNCRVGEGSSIKNAILWDNNILGNGVQLRGSIIGNHSVIDDRVRLFQESVVGNHVRIKEGATINPEVKIWPYKEVEENTLVDQHLIWGSRAKRAIFGHRDISGRLNVDIHPEFASQLGSVIASTVENDGKLIVACDLSKGSQLIKQALSNGILSAGRGVIDIGTGPLPLQRYAIIYYKAQGGIYISSDQGDENHIHIEIMNETGANISRSKERGIENLFNRGDFQRANNNQLSRILYQQEFSTAYLFKGLSLAEDLEGLKEQRRRVILASPSDSILFLGTSLMEMAGCHIKKIKTGEKPEEYFHSIESQIKEGEADIGFFLHDKGEELILFDEEGHRIQQEDYELLANLILLKKGSMKQLVVRHTFPEVLEEMAQKYAGEVLRTKSAPSQVMNEIMGRTEQSNDFLPYVLHYDGIWSSLLILDYLGKENITLNQLKKEIPNYYYRKESIPCAWQEKGKVIKKIISLNKSRNMELFEGVKIKDNKGWAIILPDSEKPLFNLYVQGVSQEYAQELTTQFSKELKDLIGEENNNQYH